MKTYILVLAIFLMAMISHAAPGDLDRTFSHDGKLTDWPGSEGATGVAIQPDGKIIIVGGGDHDFRIARYNSDGTPDITFGGGTGRVTTDFGGYDYANDVLIQPDGRILVGGTSEISSPDQGGLALARYNTDGTLDASFGGGSGKVHTLTPCWYAPYGRAGGVAIQSNGKIVGTVGINSDGNCQNEGLLVRYHSNGSLDTSFGINGAVSTEYALWFVGFQFPNGNIWAGTFGAIIPFTSDGSPLIGNAAIVPPGFSMSGHSVIFAPDGKLLAGGYSNTSPAYNFTVFRFNSNGSPDKSFGTGGVVTTPIGSGDSFGSSVAIEAGGKIVAAGTHRPTSTSSSDFALARYNTNGTIDTTFGGGDGITTVDFASLSNDHAYDVALDGQGRAIVVGGSNGMFAIARFLLAPGSVGPNRTPFDFDGDGRSDISVFRPSDRIWYLDRSTDGFSATHFGLSTDNITPADYDGDGKTDIAVYRNGTWYWLDSLSGNFHANRFGLPDDLSVPADYTGDGRAELAIYRGGQWWTFNLSNNQVSLANFGLATDKPTPADYDGDGRIDEAVYRSGVWHLNRSSLGYTAVQFGLAADRPVAGDYDGDGNDDLAVYRDGTWYLLQSTQGFAAIQWGVATDTPTPADYDGDGKTDIAVYRDGVWYLLQSTAGFSAVHFGLSGDKPIPSAFVP